MPPGDCVSARHWSKRANRIGVSEIIVFVVRWSLVVVSEREPSRYRFWRNNTASVGQSPQPPVLTRTAATAHGPLATGPLTTTPWPPSTDLCV